LIDCILANKRGIRSMLRSKIGKVDNTEVDWIKYLKNKQKILSFLMLIIRRERAIWLICILCIPLIFRKLLWTKMYSDDEYYEE
jgi:hypothetical protein